jgi:uncharacterized protein YjeT (DUF2065 family)
MLESIGALLTLLLSRFIIPFAAGALALSPLLVAAGLAAWFVRPDAVRGLLEASPETKDEERRIIGQCALCIAGSVFAAWGVGCVIVSQIAIY